MIKTDTSKSPMLKPVIEREYTKGLVINESGSASMPGAEKEIKEPTAGSQDAGAGAKVTPGSGAGPSPGTKFNLNPPPPDDTKGFVFDDFPDKGEIGDQDKLEDIGISSMSAKSFANMAGNAIQVYVPRITYKICAVDISDVRLQVEKNNLTPNWLPFFEAHNGRVAEGLKIPDDSIVMWKKAFKDYLEYKKFKFANPETAFWGATAMLVTEISTNVYQVNKTSKDLMRQALENSRPDLFIKTKKEPEKTENDGEHKQVA